MQSTDVTRRAEMPVTASDGSGRNPQEHEAGASRLTARTANFCPQTMQMMEAVVDRLIQQALHQVMLPVFDSDFSESSYGFRPCRSAHQAVLAARAHVVSGRRWVVDLDLEKFFDRVNHDVLMSRVARKVKDKRILGLIRRYLQAGVMEVYLYPRSEPDETRLG